MERDAHALPAQLDLLEQLHGRPKPPKPKTAFEWVLWENVAYLVPDEKRAQAFEALRISGATTPRGLLEVPRERLLAVTALGGMHAEKRADRLVESAELVVERFEGDLERVLRRPQPEARRALQAFPAIGAPGADKILLFTGAYPVPALESNGLRVLVRLGHAAEQKSYDATYREGVGALAPHAGRGQRWLVRAFELLRRHGQTLCKRSEPLCFDCPLEKACPFAA
jgi:endonuclease III